MNRISLLALMMVATAAAAQTNSAPQPVAIGASYTVNNGAGSQTDPHVSGDVVAYTNEAATPNEIRYHALLTGTDLAIPSTGDQDFLSDISGTRIVFTRVSGAERTVQLHDTVTGTTTELDPTVGAYRESAAIGGDTVVWVDRTNATTTSESEIVVYDLAASTGPKTQLTSGGAMNVDPAISPDGEVVTFTQCQTTGTGCDIVVARRVGGVWTSTTLAGSGEEARSSTDGSIVAYESLRVVNGVNERDIYYRNVDGTGAESVIALPGLQQNPSVAGELIAFESRPTGLGTNFDILLLDTRTGILYQLTNSTDNERLSDIDVTVDPVTDSLLVRVVYVRDEGGNNNVYAFSFVIAAPEQTCSAPPASSDEDEDDDECDEDHSGKGKGHHHHHGKHGGKWHHGKGWGHHGCDHDDHDHDDGDDDEEDDTSCSDPGTRPLLATLSVTRTTGWPNKATATFASATSGDGFLCVDNGAPTGSRATSGWVALNGSVKVTPFAFKKSVSLIERKVSLAASNSLSATIAGKPGTSYTVRVYGPKPEEECEEQSPSVAASSLRVHSVGEGDIRTIHGQRLGADALGNVPALNPQAAFESAAGCSSTGTGAGALALLVLAAFALRGRRAGVVALRRR